MAGKIDDEYEADVVIAGGALTGMWAGIRAKELDPSARVVVVDKATAGKSGCMAFAGGDITYVTPEDDLAALINRYVKNGPGGSRLDRDGPRRDLRPCPGNGPMGRSFRKRQGRQVEARNMVVLAEMIVKSASLREESRGCHFRDDYPEKDDVRFKRWSYLQQGG